jgi:hypothetical protein
MKDVFWFEKILRQNYFIFLGLSKDLINNFKTLMEQHLARVPGNQFFLTYFFV